MKRKKQEILKIHKLKKTYNRKTNTFTINITYETAPPKPTKRVIGVAESFGLGLDQQQKFTIYDNIQLKIKPKDIVYITGDSGSGKTILLKALEKDIKKDKNLTCTNIQEIKPKPNKPIIETVGKTLKEALEILSKVGLNDAFLFLRTYKQLSDGQKYRYKIAKLIEKNTQFWILDEFAATLDRDTAKIVAFNLQKIARQKGKTVIAATTHTDLKKDLNPSVHIHKKYGKEITIKYHKNKPAKQCSLTKQMQITEGTYKDYKKLSIFHYRTSRCPPPRKIFTLKRKKELCGVIVYSHPPPTCLGRSKVWKGNFKQLQKEISTITRVIIHPKYRTTGLGAKLVRETLTKAGTPYVETLAVMAKYNPFFEKAGMKKITESKPDKTILKAIEKLRKIGFNPLMLTNLNYNKKKIEEKGKQKIIKILEEISAKNSAARKRLASLQKAYPTHKEFLQKTEKMNTENLAKTLKRISFLSQTKVYLFWKKQNKVTTRKTK